MLILHSASQDVYRDIVHPGALAWVTAFGALKEGQLSRQWVLLMSNSEAPNVVYLQRGERKIPVCSQKASVQPLRDSALTCYLLKPRCCARYQGQRQKDPALLLRSLMPTEDAHRSEATAGTTSRVRHVQRTGRPVPPLGAPSCCSQC